MKGNDLSSTKRSHSIYAGETYSVSSRERMGHKNGRNQLDTGIAPPTQSVSTVCLLAAGYLPLPSGSQCDWGGGGGEKKGKKRETRNMLATTCL